MTSADGEVLDVQRELMAAAGTEVASTRFVERFANWWTPGAMAVAALTDIAMLFVRCRGGISHNPAEYSSPEQLAKGARVLAQGDGTAPAHIRRYAA